MKLEIWLRERKIGTTKEYSMHRLIDRVGDEFKPRLWPGMKNLVLFHFKHLQMEPPVLFEHLAGAGLMAYLDHCDFHALLEDADGHRSQNIYENLRYVHGRSEVMRGVPSVSAVLLANVQPAEDYNELRFRTQLPEIYRAYLDRPSKEMEEHAVEKLKGT